MRDARDQASIDTDNYRTDRRREIDERAHTHMYIYVYIFADENYRNRQVSVYLFGEFHPLTLLAVDVDHETIHLAAESAYKSRDHGLVRAAHPRGDARRR